MQDETEQRRPYGRQAPAQRTRRDALYEAIAQEELALAKLEDTEERLVLATGRYIGGGFDDARLDTLFLSLPVSWKGTMIQYAGRLHRLHQAKKESSHLRLRRPRSSGAMANASETRTRLSRSRLCER